MGLTAFSEISTAGNPGSEPPSRSQLALNYSSVVHGMKFWNLCAQYNCCHILTLQPYEVFLVENHRMLELGSGLQRSSPTCLARAESPRVVHPGTF